MRYKGLTYPVAIAEREGFQTVVCDDGSVYERKQKSDWTWTRWLLSEPVPGTTRHVHMERAAQEIETKVHLGDDE